MCGCVCVRMGAGKLAQFIMVRTFKRVTSFLAPVSTTAFTITIHFGKVRNFGMCSFWKMFSYWEENSTKRAKLRKTHFKPWSILQSWEKKLTYFAWVWRKSDPSSPNFRKCWSESCCQQPCRISQHWLMGQGWIMIEARAFAFYRTMFISVVSMGIVVIYLHEVYQLFFSMIVDFPLNASWSTKLLQTFCQ